MEKTNLNLFVLLEIPLHYGYSIKIRQPLSDKKQLEDIILKQTVEINRLHKELEIIIVPCVNRTIGYLYKVGRLILILDRENE